MSPRPASVFAYELEKQGRHDLGHADTIVAPADSLRPRTRPVELSRAEPPTPPPREPGLFARAASAVAQKVRGEPAPDHSRDPTVQLSEADLRSLTVSEDSDRD